MGGGGQNFLYICSRQLFKSIKSKRSNWMKYEWKIYVCNKDGANIVFQ